MFLSSLMQLLEMEITPHKFSDIPLKPFAQKKKRSKLSMIAKQCLVRMSSPSFSSQTESFFKAHSKI